MIKDLNKSVNVMCSFYSHKFDIQIKLSDGRAQTVNNVIYIPKPKSDYLDFTWAFCANQAAPLRFSQSVTFPQLEAATLYQLKRVYHLLEQSRVELVFLKDFPGVRRYLDSASEEFLAIKSLDELFSIKPESLFETWTLLFTRGYLTGYACWNPFAQKLDQMVRDALSPKHHCNLISILAKVHNCHRSVDTLSVACEFVDYLSNLSPTQFVQSLEANADAQADAQADANADAKADANADRYNCSGSTEWFTENDVKNTADDLAQALSSCLSQTNTHDRITSIEREDEQFGTQLPCMPVSSYLDSLISDARSLSAKGRRALLTYLEDQYECRRSLGKTGRQVSASKFYRLKQGNLNFFKRKQSKDLEIDVDIALLLDTSGSLGDYIRNVKLAAIAFLKTLNTVEGVNTSCFAFGLYDGKSSVAEIQAPSEIFGQTTVRRIASLSSEGNTPAVSGYWAAIHSLNLMTHKKKVIIMITDGVPDDTKLTKEMVDSCINQGIDIICVGIGHLVREVPFFDYIYGVDNWLKVKNFDDLPNELLRLSKKLF